MSSDHRALVEPAGRPSLSRRCPRRIKPSDAAHARYAGGMVERAPAGKILIDGRGAMHVEAMHFEYAPEWRADETAPALSHAMPKWQCEP